MSSSFSFMNFITNKYYNKIKNSINEFLSTDPFIDTETKEEIIGYVCGLEPKIVNFSSFDMPFKNFRIAYCVDVGIDYFIEDQEMHDSKYFWYTLTCSCKESNGFNYFKVKKVEYYVKKSLNNSKFSDSLVPYIGKDNYEEAADYFIKKYDLLNKSLCADDELKNIASKMQLSIRQTRITKDKSVFGQLYFYDTDAPFYDYKKKCYVMKHVPAKTIVVDEAIVKNRLMGTLNNTVYHEFVHYEFHRHFIELRKAYGAHSNINCKVELNDDNSDYCIIESQARALAPKIIMRRLEFSFLAKRMIDNETSAIITNLASSFPGFNIPWDPVYSMELVIRHLADKFHVSNFSVRLRLIELGFNLAKGSMIYLDNHYVESHRSSENFVLKDNQSFAISKENFYKLFENNISFRELFLKGNFIFANNFVIIDDEKYIVQFVNGESVLTPYALTHMEECCLIFDSDLGSYKGRAANAEYLYLNNNKSFGEIPLSFDINNQINVNIIPYDEELELVEYIDSNSFSDSFYKVTEHQRKKLEIKVEVFAKDLGLDNRTLLDYRKGKIPNIKVLIAICLYLKVSTLLIYKLMDKSGYHLVPKDNHSHYVYQRILTTRNGYDYKVICKEIADYGGEPLL